MRFSNAVRFALLIAVAGRNHGFADEDIVKVKDLIRAEFEKRPGIKVLAVQMMKESPTKLMGFVKVNARCSERRRNRAFQRWEMEANTYRSASKAKAGGRAQWMARRRRLRFKNWHLARTS